MKLSKNNYNTIKRVTSSGKCRTEYNGYEELIRLNFQQQRDILMEVADMRGYDEWRGEYVYDCIKEVIEVSINLYYPTSKGQVS